MAEGFTGVPSTAPAAVFRAVSIYGRPASPAAVAITIQGSRHRSVPPMRSSSDNPEHERLKEKAQAPYFFERGKM